VIATGGYERNAELMLDFEGLPGHRPQSPPSLTGDGLIIAAEIGGAIRRIQNNFQMMLGYTVIPDGANAEPIECTAGIVELCSPHTLVVNRRGLRFADESAFQSMVSPLKSFDAARHEYPNLPCYLIFDAQYAAKYSFGRAPLGAPIPRCVSRSDNVPGLAAALKIDPEGLTGTVSRFNGFAAAGRDADFRRGEAHWRMAKSDAPAGQNASLGTLTRAPFYGIELRPSLLSSSAGLLTDVHGQVVHQRRHPIPGLYATGLVAARTELGAGYQAGLNLASAVTFSYLATRHMMA
jgi:3-oxosteroid 1-dehydrogenase